MYAHINVFIYNFGLMMLNLTCIDMNIQGARRSKTFLAYTRGSTLLYFVFIILRIVSCKLFFLNFLAEKKAAVEKLKSKEAVKETSVEATDKAANVAANVAEATTVATTPATATAYVTYMLIFLSSCG